MNERNVLKASFLLRDIPEHDVSDAIALLVPQTVAYQKGDVLASVGERICSLRFISRGNALVFRDPEHRTLLSILDVGDCFGVANLFAESPTYPTEIVASTAVVCLEISESALKSLFMAYPVSALNYISFLSEKIRFLNRRVGDFSCGSAEKKVARLLSLSSDGTESLMLRNLRQTAESMGLGRASLYRVLVDLEGRGIIRKDGKQITVLKQNELKGILS